MTSPRQVSPLEGYGRSPRKTFTIPDEANGSLVAAADLETNYSFVVIRAPSTAVIPAATTFSLWIGDHDSDELLPLWNPDTGTLWNSGTLPTTGGFRMLVPAAFGAQRVRIVMSANITSGPLALHVYGLDPVVKNSRKRLSNP